MPVAAHAFVGIDPRRGFDLENVGAEIRENADAGGACPDPLLMAKGMAWRTELMSGKQAG